MVPALQHAAGVIYPWRGDTKAAALWLRWSLHCLLWTGLLCGLWYLNRQAGMERFLRSPWPMVHRQWLPLLGLLVYVLGWLSRGLWLALRADPPPSAWPDIDAAWSETIAGLEGMKITASEAPLFLVRGPRMREVDSLLESMGATPLPSRVSPPFRVFARTEGIFVLCDNLERRDSLTARLHHLAELLARHRAPAPVQGIVLVAPYGNMKSDADAHAMLEVVQNNLTAIRQATGFAVPIYVTVTGLDLEFARGDVWLQRFPPTPDLDPADIPAMLEAGVDRLCLDTIVGDPRDRFQLDEETAEPGKPGPALRDNLRLYQWLGAIRAWRARLALLLAEGTQIANGAPGMVAGCYVLPADTKSPELPKVLWHDLQTYRQTAVCTPEAIAAQTEQSRRTWIGYGVGILGAGACLAAAAWLLVKGT